MENIKTIKEIIDHLTEFVSIFNIEGLFIAGEYCRSVWLDDLDAAQNIDVVCAYGDEQASQLGTIFASELLKTTPLTSNNKTIINWKSLTINFQGNSIFNYMKNKEILNWMSLNNIDSFPLMNNVCGRDFTINSIVYSLNNKKFYDLFGRASKDIEKKMISSILPANLLVTYNPISILKAIRFSVKYDFFIEKDLHLESKNCISNLEKTYTKERITHEIIKIIHIDALKGLELVKKYELGRFLVDQDVEDILGIKR